MSKRLKQVNKHIQRIFGEILQREADVPDDVLVTISQVDTTPNLKSSTVWLYIMPLERSEEVMAILREQMYDLQGALNRALELRPLPRISLEIDRGAEHAATIEQTLASLKEDERDEPTENSPE